MTVSDEFLGQAAKEYQAGNIDQALWDRTSAQFEGDQALMVAAYLRVRATALELKKREERRMRRTGGAPEPASAPQVEVQPRPETAATKTAGAGRFGGRPALKYAAAAGALAAVAIVLWVLAAPRGSESVSPTVAAAGPARPVASPAGAQPIVKDAGGTATQAPTEITLEAKVRQLQQAGNWNVLVLYASEWTRKEPGNAAAWNQLSIGYANLRQLGDAREAATKAVQLSPDDSRHWRNLAHVNLALERLPEARAAFEKVLAATPDDADALCGAARVAKGEGRAKDAEGLAARVKSIAGSCADASDAESSAVVAGGSAAQPARSRSR